MDEVAPIKKAPLKFCPTKLVSPPWQVSATHEVVNCGSFEYWHGILKQMMERESSFPFQSILLFEWVLFDFYGFESGRNF